MLWIVDEIEVLRGALGNVAALEQADLGRHHVVAVAPHFLPLARLLVGNGYRGRTGLERHGGTIEWIGEQRGEDRNEDSERKSRQGRASANGR